MQDLIRLIGAIGQWHEDRNLIEGSDDKTQFAKLVSEVGELADSIAKGETGIALADHLGDIIVVLINIMRRNGLMMVDVLEVAYNDIKDRKGRMINGTFVKGI